MFSNIQVSSFLTGALSKYEIIGILEPTDYSSLDRIFLFFEAITDVMCRKESEPEITEFLTECVKILHCLQEKTKHQNDWKMSLTFCIRE